MSTFNNLVDTCRKEQYCACVNKKKYYNDVAATNIVRYKKYKTVSRISFPQKTQ